MVTDRPSTLPRGQEVDSGSGYGADGSTSQSRQPITNQDHQQMSRNQQPITVQYQMSSTHQSKQSHVFSGSPVDPTAGSTSFTTTSTPAAVPGPAEKNMAATRQQGQTPAPDEGGPHPSSSSYHPSLQDTSLQGHPMHVQQVGPPAATSNGNIEDILHDYEDIDEDEARMSKTIVLTAYGGLDKLEVQNKPRRNPSNGEVLIKVQESLKFL